VAAERVPSAGEAPVATPALVVDRELDPGSGGELELILPPLAVHEAMLVTVERIGR